MDAATDAGDYMPTHVATPALKHDKGRRRQASVGSPPGPVGVSVRQETQARVRGESGPCPYREAGDAAEKLGDWPRDRR